MEVSRKMLVSLLLALLFVLPNLGSDVSHLSQSSSDPQAGPDEDSTVLKYHGPVKRHLPKAIIMGAKKAGTRALLSFIKIHPDVQAPGPEIHFFDRNFHKGLEWYRRRMPPSVDDQITMEKTPGYFVSPEAPERINQMNSSMRLVLVVRDPVTRALSDYAQASENAHKAGNTLKPFEDLAFLPGTNYSVVDTSWQAIKVGLYAKHLQNWYRFFPKKQILIVSGEKLVKDPASVLNQLQDFLGLSRLVSERHFYRDRRKGFPCLKKAGKGGRPRCLDKTKGRRHPKVQARIIKTLREFYAPHNQQFRVLTGLDFGWDLS